MSSILNIFIESLRTSHYIMEKNAGLFANRSSLSLGGDKGKIRGNKAVDVDLMPILCPSSARSFWFRRKMET